MARERYSTKFALCVGKNVGRPACQRLITESSLDLESGRLVILGCTDHAPDAVRGNVVPGRYRARVFYYDQQKLSDDKLDGDDRYRVALWPAPELVTPRVLVDKRTPRPSQRAR